MNKYPKEKEQQQYQPISQLYWRIVVTGYYKGSFAQKVTKKGFQGKTERQTHDNYARKYLAITFNMTGNCQILIIAFSCSRPILYHKKEEVPVDLEVLRAGLLFEKR